MTVIEHIESPHRNMLAVLAILTTICTLVGGMVLESVPVFAAKVYKPGLSFGSKGSNPSQLNEPVGVAVNDSTNSLTAAAAGDLYVVDKGNNRVERFSATGEYKGQFNGTGTYEDVEEVMKVKMSTPAPAGQLASPEQIAVDSDETSPTFGDVYVTDTGHKVIDEFGATGEYIGQITEGRCPPAKSTTEEGLCPPGSTVPFKTIYGVAVDPGGDLWVSYGIGVEPPKGMVDINAVVVEFSDTGKFIQAFDTGYQALERDGLAVDSAESAYLDDGNSVLKLDSATGKQVGTVGTFGEGAFMVGVNPSSESVLTDEGDSIALYKPFGEPYGTPPKETFSSEGFAESYGLAVNSTGTVYASERGADKVQIFYYVPLPTVTTEMASGVNATDMTLHGSVNPEGEAVTECYFEYGIEAEVYPNKVACEQQPEAIKGTTNVPVSSPPLTELPSSDVRSFRLVASNANGTAQGQGITISRPVLTNEAISEVSSTTATVIAQLDVGGLASCYHIEYGTSTVYGAEPPPQECVGAGDQSIGVHVELGGLQPGTFYDFRIVATNALGTTHSNNVPFATFPSYTSELPDGRVYELVTPVGPGHDTEVYVPAGLEGALDPNGEHGIETGLPFETTASGDAVTYLGDPPTDEGNGNIGDGGGNQYVARRSGDDGWAQVDAGAPGPGNKYVGFSSDLTLGVLTTSEPLAVDAPLEYANLYSHPTAGGAFEPLITAAPEHRIPSEFGSVLNGELFKAPLFAGANSGTSVVPAFSHLLFEADAALPSTPAAPEGGKLENNLYDRVGGKLYLVNVMPEDKPEANATFGRQGPAENGFQSPETSNVISEDGSKIFWSTVEAVKVGSEYEERPKALFVRENDTQPESPVEGGECTVPTDACTVQVDKNEGGAGPGGEGSFWTASDNGSKVFFTDENGLTPESTAASKEPDLYEYNLEAFEGEGLTDLSVGTKARTHADVQGVVGVSEDGSYVYLVADGKLTEGKNTEEKEPVPGSPNLYLRHDGVTTFIATLANEDDDFTHGTGGHDGDWQADPGHRTAEVTPDGHDVVFMSRLSLTGYENTLEGVHLTEVFVYNADTGALTCVSCNPSGETPVSSPTFPEFSENLSKLWGAFVPISDSLADYQPRVISDDGNRVFFDSIEPLVPQATNGFLNVYEWERQGTGSCHEARNCIYLLSEGQSTDNAYLIDASADGDNVFVVTRGQLVKEDRGDDDELYDARVDGARPPEEAACSGTGCQGVPPAPPIFATPASVTFEGAGNLSSTPPVTGKEPTPKAVKCIKGRELRRGKCVKVKIKRKHRPKAKKSRRRSKR